MTAKFSAVALDDTRLWNEARDDANPTRLLSVSLHSVDDAAVPESVRPIDGANAGYFSVEIKMRTGVDSDLQLVWLLAMREQINGIIDDMQKTVVTKESRS